MNKFRSATLALVACAASLSLAACSAGTTTASSSASSSAAANQGVTTSAPPSTGAPIPSRMLQVKGPLGSFPVPATAKVGENISGGSSLVVVFGLITPADVARFYATALPQAGYAVAGNSLVSKGGQNGAIIVFSGHGYKGTIDSVNQVTGPTFAGVGGQNVTTIIMSATK